MYTADTSQSSAQFAANPLIVFAQALYDIDRSNGQFFPQVEGDGFYVEQCDYPVIVSLIDQSTGVERTFILSTGMEVCARFKGLTLVHPLLTRVFQNDTHTLKLVMFRGGSKRNQFAYPFLGGLPPSVRQITNTAVLQSVGIAIPPGARAVEGLHLLLTGTAITSAVVVGNVIRNGAIFSAVSAPVSVVQNGAAYNANNALSIGMNTRAIGAASIAAEYLGKIILPTWANELQVTIVGTGMAPQVNVLCNFA